MVRIHRIRNPVMEIDFYEAMRVVAEAVKRFIDFFVNLFS